MAQRKKIKCVVIVSIIFLIGVYSGAIGASFLVNYGATQVYQNANFDKGTTLSFKSLNISASHYIYVTYKVNGDSEITWAFWRLKSNKVEVEM